MRSLYAVAIFAASPVPTTSTSRWLGSVSAVVSLCFADSAVSCSVMQRTDRAKGRVNIGCFYILLHYAN